MTVLQQTFPPLTGGVSQLPDSQQGPGTVRACDDFLPDPVWGLAKRPGSELVNSLGGLPAEGSWFNITPNEDEDFLVFITHSGVVRVLDAVTGVEHVVSSQAAAYAAHKTQLDIEVLQVGDFVFVVNRTIDVQKDPAVSPTRLAHAWLALKAVSFDAEYKVDVAVVSTVYSADYTSPETGTVSIASVLDGIKKALEAVLPTTIVLSSVNNIISFSHSDPAVQTPINITATGGATGDSLMAYGSKVSDISVLPAQYFADRPVMIQSNVSPDSNYWVTYQRGELGSVTTVEDIAKPVSGSYPAGEYRRLVRLQDGRLYASPKSATQTARIYDPTTGLTSTPAGNFKPTLANFTSTPEWAPGVLMSDGRVYIPARYGTQSLIYNPVANTLVVAGGVFNTSGRGHSGGVRMNDGRIFLIPKDVLRWSIYNPTTNTIVQGPNNQLSYPGYDEVWSDGVLLDNGKVMLCPYETSNIAIYDPKTNTLSTSGNGTAVGGKSRSGCVKLLDGRVYLPSNNYSGGEYAKGRIYNPATNTTIAAGGTLTVGQTFGAPILLPNGEVYMPVLTAATGNPGKANIYDPVLDTIREVKSPEFPSSAGFTCGAYLVDGSIFLIPSVGTQAVLVKKVTTTQLQEVSQGTWVETIQAGEQYKVDNSTMPHALIRTATNAWIVQALSGTSLLPPTGTAAGVPTSVSVDPPETLKGWYGIGQVLPMYGGTGRGLKLRVTEVDQVYSSPTQVKVLVPGSGYTLNEIVRTLNGDRFTITGVTSVTRSNPIEFANQSWTERTVGSTLNMPWPSFVGKPITGIGFFMNRLILLSQDTVIASRAGDYLNFWPSSAVQVIPDDPIDLSAGATTAISFRYTVPYNKQLVLVSEKTQYALRSTENVFDPFNAELSPISNIKTSMAMAPLRNQLAWFVLEEGPAGVRVYSMVPGKDDDPNLAGPELLNVQAPSYIPSYVFTGGVDPDSGFIALGSARARNNVYLWRWTDVGRQRVQNAWFRYTCPQSIQHIYLLNDYLYVLGSLNGSTVISRIRLGVTNPQGIVQFMNNSFNVRLDMQFWPSSVVYNDVTGVTTIDISGSEFSKEPGVFVLDGPKRSTYLTGTVVGDYLLIDGDLKTVNVVVGQPYTAKALLPHIYVRGQDTQYSANPPKVHRIKVRGFETGSFDVTLKVPGRKPFTKTCALRTPSTAVLDTENMFRVTGSTVPCMCDGDRMDLTVEAPYPLPTHIQEITWNGTYTQKGIVPR